MIQDGQGPDEGSETTEERSLQRRHEMPAPLAAMADALRANAEALRRIDSSQRHIAETIAKGDRASQVVASTRALNETFRGLSEIQRGLLDAVLKGRRGGGSPLLAFGVALLVALLAVLLYDRWMASRVVPVERLEEARAEAARVATEAGGLRSDLRAAAERERALAADLAERDAAAAERRRADEARVARIAELEKELEAKKARLENFLAVKSQADLAAALQVRNATLEREVATLEEKIGRLEAERAASLEYFGEKLLDLRGVDPAQVKEIARKMGVLEEPAPAPVPGDAPGASRATRRLVVNQLNGLFPDGEEAYEVLEVGAVADGWRLRDVTLLRHRNNRLVTSLKCGELTVLADPSADTVELRLRDGHMANTGRPGERIPIPEEGHSIFLTDVGLSDWLRRCGGRVALGDGGRLTWK